MQTFKTILRNRISDCYINNNCVCLRFIFACENLFNLSFSRHKCLESKQKLSSHKLYITKFEHPSAVSVIEREWFLGINSRVQNAYMHLFAALFSLARKRFPTNFSYCASPHFAHTCENSSLISGSQLLNYRNLDIRIPNKRIKIRIFVSHKLSFAHSIRLCLWPEKLAV